MRALLALCSLVAAGDAFADNMRDGCPNGRDVPFTKFGRYGAFAAPDSLLQTNRFSASTAGTYISSRVSDNDKTKKFWTNRFDTALRRNWLVGTASLVSATDLTAPEEESGTFGTLTLGIGIAQRFRTAIYARPDSSGKSDLSSNKEESSLAGVRKGRGFVINASIARNGERRGPANVEMLPSTVFADKDDHYRLEGLGARLEYRTEIVGCWAPFIHIEVAPHWSFPLGEGSSDPLDHVLVLPAAITGGLQVTDPVSLYLQYRLQTIAGGLRGTDVVTFDVLHRFRIGFEAAWYPWWRLNGFLDLAPGGGTGFGFTLTFAFDRSYR